MPTNIAAPSTFVSLTLLVFTFSCTPSSSDGDAGIEPDANVPNACDDLVDLTENEASFNTLTGFSGSEDFAFDGEGHIVSLDRNGNLTKQTFDEGPQIIAPDVGAETAGIRLLANGDAVVANVGEGSLQRITPEGAKSTILSGIAYPNGVEVDLEGQVYVAEHDAGRVRKVNPDTGDFEIIAEGIFNPNGLSFSPDYQTLYIGSFGGGTIHRVFREGESFSEKELFSQVTSPTIVQNCGEPGGGCFDLAANPGRCDENLTCIANQPSVCTLAGEACTSPNLTPSHCVTNLQGDLACPEINAPYVLACSALTENDACSVGQDPGTCSPFNEFLACDTGSYDACGGLDAAAPCYNGGFGVCTDDVDFGRICVPLYIADENACDAQARGERCISNGILGTCEDGSHLGKAYDLCVPKGWTDPTQNGGLDGLNTDACGNVYITEFTTGKIYRLPADGSVVETLITLPSSWIPNIHWGYGIGGFDAKTLYVMDRDEGRLFAVDTGVGGTETLLGNAQER